LNKAFLLPKDFIADPGALNRSFSLAESAAYTRWLSRSHYENFHVVTFLLPKRLRQDFYNVYAFCRWADDLGDEIGDPAESLRLLDWWNRELDAMYEGQASHPVFVALRDSALRHGLPKEPFAHLIRAFVQDQTVHRYVTWDHLFDYCRCSANPVGRLVLHLCGCSDPERRRLSDSTCTGLQLANFWQDVTVDLQKDRVYIPLEVFRRHGAYLEDLLGRRFTPAFCSVMREAVSVARCFFLDGLPLARMVSRRLSLDVDLFSRGGLRLLDKIERRGYNVLARRPAISRLERAGLLLSSLLRVTFSRAA